MAAGAIITGPTSNVIEKRYFSSVPCMRLDSSVDEASLKVTFMRSGLGSSAVWSSGCSPVTGRWATAWSARRPSPSTPNASAVSLSPVASNGVTR